MLAIVDYQMGNLRSVQKAFQAIGVDAVVVDDPQQIRKADRLVLPGVGAFRDAIGLLRSTQLDQAVLEHIQTGKPLLGVCLGMQLLFDQSEEGGIFEGLGVVPGKVVAFDVDPSLKIPHMGWNTAKANQTSNAAGMKVLADEESTESDPFYYFVHGYYCQPSASEHIGLETEYGLQFCSAVTKDNVVATQFHPEKSQASGLKLLKRFADWTC